MLYMLYLIYGFDSTDPQGRWTTTGFSVTFFLFLTILCLSSHMKNIYYQLMFNGILPKDLWLNSDFIDFSRGKDHVVHCAFWTVDTCSPSYILESSFIIWIFFSFIVFIKINGIKSWLLISYKDRRNYQKWQSLTFW